MEPEENYSCNGTVLPHYDGDIKTHKIKIHIPLIRFFNAGSFNSYPSSNASQFQMPRYVITESTLPQDLLFHGPESITPSFLQGLMSEDKHIRIWEIYLNSLNHHPNGKHLLEVSKVCYTDSINLIKPFLENEFGSIDPFLIPDIIQSRSIMDFSPLMTPGDLLQKLFDRAYQEFVIMLRKELDLAMRKGIEGIFPNGEFLMEPNFRLSSYTAFLRNSND